MANKINCFDIRDKKIKIIKEIIKKRKLKNIGLGIITSKNFDEASRVYVSKKIEMCKTLGIKSSVISIDKNIFDNKNSYLRALIREIKYMNNDNLINGFLVQMPLPFGIKIEDFNSHIRWYKDVDGFTSTNENLLRAGSNSGIIPCTPKAVMDIFNHEEINLKGKTVLIINRSNLVGKPLQALMLNSDATVIQAHSYTRDIQSLIDVSDILILGAGSNQMIKEYQVLDKHIIIDVSINRNNDGMLVGDLDKNSYKSDKEFLYTSVPGGVGILTVTNVIENLIKCLDIQEEEGF